MSKVSLDEEPRTDPNRARRRGRSFARRGSRTVKTGEDLDDRDRGTSFSRACTRLRTAVQEYLMYHFWLPLTGLVAVGSAFTAAPWLAICDLVVGLVLLHSQLLQAAMTCHVHNVQVDNALVLAALMLSIVTLIVRIAQTSGKEVWFLDAVYVITATLAVICATCRSHRPATTFRFGQVPCSPVLFLSMAAATLAPAAILQLPYALIFLTLTDSLLKNSWKSMLSVPARLCLLAMTSAHIATLLAMNFMSWSEIKVPNVMLGLFGETGRTIIRLKDTVTTCASNPGPSCLSRDDSIWTGLHLCSVLLLHFVLSNYTEQQGDKSMGKSLSVNSSASTLQAQNSFVQRRLVRSAIVLILLCYFLAFPSFLTLPLLILYVWKTFVSASAVEMSKSQAPARSRGGCGCRCRSQQDVEDRGCTVRLGWARYAALVFLILYTYNALEVLLDTIWPQAAETLTSLRLRMQIMGVDIVRVLGLNIHRIYDPHTSPAALVPQALMLLTLAALQAMLDGDMAGWPRYAEKASRKLWVYACRQTPAELSMLFVLFGFLTITSSAAGETSVLLMAYALLWAKLVCGKLEVGQPRSWWVLQLLAQSGLVLVTMLFLLAPRPSARNSVAVQIMYEAFPELKREHHLRVILPHLFVGFCAYVERLRIAEASLLNMDGTHKKLEGGTSSWQTDTYRPSEGRCMRTMIRYKNLAVAKLRKWTDELICIFVLVLSFAASLVPGTDIHSLALLLGTGPALLLYNTRGTNRSRKLDCGFMILRFSTASMFVFRLTAASMLLPWPDDAAWPISLKELGVNRPLQDPPFKLTLLGIIPVSCRLAIIATIRVHREEAERKEHLVDDVPGAEDIETEAPIPDEHSGEMELPSKDDAVSNVSLGNSPRRLSVRFEKEADEQRPSRRTRGPSMEERFLTWLIPSWMEFMPLNMHLYLSALLLVLVFALSIQEVNVLSFIMMLAVVLLCGWSKRWVQAGNVFSCTTLAVMWLQYLARFRYFDEVGTSDVWLRRVGLEWTSSQVEKHCCILVVCILQKQYWYRGRFSKARPVICPRFVANHADMAGFFGLISVAVIRRHALSTLLVLGALPWVVREELPFKESDQRQAHTKWWLRWFRFVLFLILIVEVSLRLLLNFNLGDDVGRDQFISWICDEFWRGRAPPSSMDSCRSEFARWIDDASNNGEGSTPYLMLMEFLCLFFLGIIQQLLECVSLQVDETKTLQRKKLTVLYWWPILVWLCTFTVSLARGTVIGLCFLLLLVGMTFNHSSAVPTLRRWVWRARLFALLFLIVGLAFQSPLLPCSRAACDNGVHQIYLTLDRCIELEAWDLSEVGAEAVSSRCHEGAAAPKAHGHDTTWTLAVQILGIRRVKGETLWDGILALFLSQLGQLVLLVMSCTVQLRMYSSRLFGEYKDVFVEEPEDVILARAQRYATEFYCGVKLEEQASQHRIKALVEKLHRTKHKIQDLLRYNQEILSKSNGRSAAVVKPASSKQVTDILKYAGEKNLAVVPLVKEKSSGKCVWKTAKEKQLAEMLKKSDLPDELVLSILRVNQLEVLDDETSAATAVQEILQLRDKRAVRDDIGYLVRKSHEDEDVAIEELQLSCGLVKDDAQKVIKMFASNATIGKRYARLLHEITCGRLNPDGSIVRNEVQKLIDAVQVYQEISGQVEKRRRGVYPSTTFSSTVSLRASLASRTESERSVEEEKSCEKVLWERLKSFATPHLATLSEWWEGFKCSQLLGRMMCDHAFLGLDEERYRVDAVRVGVDEICEHRRGNNLPRILWKLMLSNMPILTALFCTLAFVLNRSILDAARVLLVIFACLRLYPFPANWIWSVLKYYSISVLLLRTLYDLPIVCAGFQLRQPREAEAVRLTSEPSDSYQWCPVFTEIGIDILVGFAKRSTASSLEGTELWIDAVWADHLCIWAVLMHQWMVQRYGVGRFVIFDSHSQRLWLRKSVPSPHAPMPIKLKASLGTWGSSFRDMHSELVSRWWKLRQNYIQEFEAQDDLFHRYQEQLEEESTTSQSEEPELDDVELREERPKMMRTTSEPLASRLDPSRITSRDAALLLHSSKSLLAVEWASEWAKARGRRRGFFTSCRAPRELDFHPPRRLFPVHRGEHPHETEDEAEERRWSQALQWAQVVGHRFMVRQKRLHQRTGHRLTATREDKVVECAICSIFVMPDERHWHCAECGYHICKTCSFEIMQGRRPRDKLMKPGVSLYSAKYFFGFLLLCYALLSNQAILKEEERSFSQSLQENNFSVATLFLIVAHLTILLSDRIFFKAHYSMRGRASLRVIEIVNLGLILAEFIFLHWHTIAILYTSVNPREATISLASDVQLCIYYLIGMVYISLCMLQIKHGLPALGNDSLRPKNISLFSASSIYTEKLWYFLFLIHYNMPFVDDIRVIVDWTVVPTSLDLWMYWKVEDAHSAFYRSRHLMFVRGQSHYAEERDILEKFYNGWAILCAVVLVILMPIIVFSPFSPFPNTVLVEEANLVLGMTVASSCVGEHRHQLCRYVDIELFKAPAIQIQRYNNSQKSQYLQDNPRVNADIDIQDIKWPWFSQEALHTSPALIQEVQEMLDEENLYQRSVAVVYDLRYTLQRSVLGASSHSRSLCSCAPPHCEGLALHTWPARIHELCTASDGREVSIGPGRPIDRMVNSTRSWWREATEAAGEAVLVVPALWSPRVNLGNAGLTERSAVKDFTFGLASRDCDGLRCAQRWGSLRSSNASFPPQENETLQLKVELEKSVNVQGVTGEASSSYTSALGLYVAVVLVAGKYLRAAFQGASKQAIYDEIPDVHVFLDLIEAIKMAREHGDLRVEFELYYCLMQVLRSTHILLRIGGHEPRNYGIGRTDRRPTATSQEIVRL